MTRFLLAFLACFACAGSAPAAGIIVPAEQRYQAWSGELPACADAGVLARIQDRFAQTESGYWHSPARIASFDRIGQISLRGNGRAYIPRRYCVARAWLDNGRRRETIYAIGEDLGILGYGFGVEWCVVGLDRNLAYAPGCQILRPYLARNLGARAISARY